MTYTLFDGQGSMFEDKKTTPSSPDYTGKLVLDGKTFRIAAWSRSSVRSGQKFLSLKVEPLTPSAEETTNPGDTARACPTVSVNLEPGPGETSWELTTPRGPEQMILREGVAPPSHDWRVDSWYHDRAYVANLVKRHPDLTKYAAHKAS